MTTHNIQIEGLPEGWEVKPIKLPAELFNDDKTKICYGTYIEIQKAKPRRIVLEETEEDADASKWQRFEIGNYPIFVECDKILREIKEE